MKKACCFILLPVLLLATSCRAPKDLVYQNVQNFSMKQGGLDKTMLAMDIRLYNPNRYSLKLKKADVDVFVNGKPLGKMNAAGQYRLAALDTASLPVTLEVDMKNVLSNMLQVFLNGDVDVKLTGSIKAGRHGIYITIPVSYEGKQDIMSGIKF